MSDTNLTTFDYLLNRMEAAAASADPAKAGYAKARRDVLGFVKATEELSSARNSLLVAYRTTPAGDSP